MCVVVVAGSIRVSHGSNRSASEVQQAAGHVAHISLPQPVPPFPQECEVHPVGAANRRPQSTCCLHPPFCVSQGGKKGQKGEQLSNEPFQSLCDRVQDFHKARYNLSLAPSVGCCFCCFCIHLCTAFLPSLCCIFDFVCCTEVFLFDIKTNQRMLRVLL